MLCQRNCFSIGLFIVTSLLVKISSRLSSNYAPSYNYHTGEQRGKVVNYRQVEKNILDKILSPTIYDSQIRPKGVKTDGKGSNSTEPDGPTTVLVNLFVRSFEKIDDVKMEFSVQITFRQQWNDNRLSFNNIGGKIKYLTLTERNKVWMPDTFFRNEKDAKFHDIIQPNLYVRVFPDGDVLYSIRVSLTLACPMNLKLFPLDTQTCHLTIASYGWTANDLIYTWKYPNPVQLATNLFLPGGFELARYADSKCDVETATGLYSCLSVDMMFKRQLSYYVFTIYIPTFMTVCVSWMSFWLDHKSAPARVALTITTLLAMSTTTSSINNSLPPVAYTKAIDVWNNICVSFVFLALLEYALVNYAARADARAIEMRRAAQKQLDMEQTMCNGGPLPNGGLGEAGAAADGVVGGGNQCLLDLYGDNQPANKAIEMRRAAQKQLDMEQTMCNGGPLPNGGLGEAGGAADGVVGGGNQCLLDLYGDNQPANNYQQAGTGEWKPRKQMQMLAEWLPTVRQNGRSPGLVQSVIAPVMGLSGINLAYSPGAKKIDVLARILFPAMFACLNIIYWSYYLTMADLQSNKQ